MAEPQPGPLHGDRSTRRGDHRERLCRTLSAPRREYVSEDLPPAAREWALLNTVIPYGEPEPDRRAVRHAEPEREPRPAERSADDAYAV